MLSADVWALFGWVDPRGLIGSFNLGPPEYAALVTFFTGALLALNITLIWRQLPHEKFLLIAEEISYVMQLVVSADEQEKPRPHLESKLRELSFNLDKLGVVQHPDILDIVGWYEWLPTLLAMAKTKRLRAARLSWKKKDERAE